MKEATGELTLEKMNKLFQAVADSPTPKEFLVSMTDDEFEAAKAAGLNVERVDPKDIL